MMSVLMTSVDKPIIVKAEIWWCTSVGTDTPDAGGQIPKWGHKDGHNDMHVRKSKNKKRKEKSHEIKRHH